jgi:hypothetical protein
MGNEPAVLKERLLRDSFFSDYCKLVRGPRLSAVG